MDIEGGTPYVIFAWGDTLTNNDISYHFNNRGAKTLPLIASLNAKIDIDMNKVETTEFKVDVNIMYLLTNIFFLKNII